MPSLTYYLQRAGEQPWQETLNQARMLVTEVLRRRTQPVYDRLFRNETSKEAILKRCGFSTAAEMAIHFKYRKTPVFPELPFEASKQADLQRPKSWHVDPRSGYQWNPALHYKQVPLTPKHGVDIKGPWGLSRCHHMVILGQRYQTSGDEKYAEEFVLQCSEWIKSNPCRYGVNWVSAMEAGIRVVNWIAAFFLMRNAKPVSDTFVLDFVTSLYAHADFIRTNLEYRESWVEGRFQRLNSNHYLCDLAGLLHVALLFPELDLTAEREFAAKELEAELFVQTTPDGVDYEHSTSYHCFVLEIFRSCFFLLDQNGYPPRGSVQARLKQMEDFVASFSHPDGSIPQIGDNDSGRILPLGFGRPVPETSSRAFPNAGFYSMCGRDAHVFISAATVGVRGFGSHSHNDILSFEYWYSGQAWIVDPGTYVYLPDPDARNWFRSTAAHNTVRVDGEEINPFHRGAVFQMIDRAKVQVDNWNSSEQEDILEAHHTGYAALNNGVVHRRRFNLDKETARLAVHDTLEGNGLHEFEWFLQVHPAVKVDLLPGMAILGRDTLRVRIRMDCPGSELSCVEGWYSSCYGLRERTNRIVARLSAQPPLSALITIEPC